MPQKLLFNFKIRLGGKKWSDLEMKLTVSEDSIQMKSALYVSGAEGLFFRITNGIVGFTRVYQCTKYESGLTLSIRVTFRERRWIICGIVSSPSAHSGF